MKGRALLIVVGALGMAYGAYLLLAHSSFPQLVSTAFWLVGGVVAHDFLLAPLVIGVVWLGGRALPAWARGPVIIGGLLLGTITVFAIPVLGGWGRRADNPSLLDRHYVLGWVVVALVVLLGVVVAAGVARARESRPRP